MTDSGFDDGLHDEAIEWFARRRSPRPGARNDVAFARWMNSAPAARAAFAEVESLWETLAVAEQMPLPAVETEPAKSKPAESKSAKTKPARRPWWRAFLPPLSPPAIAGAIAVLVIIVAGASLAPRFLAPSYETAVGEQQSLHLADGSAVLLNTDTQLSVKLTDRRRLVRLNQGEAFFDVVHDPARPFTVITPEGAVRDVGTKFSVRSEAGVSTVTVLEGVVAVSDQPDKNATAWRVRLTPDQQVSLSKAAGLGAVQAVRAANALSWRHHKLVYDGAPLEEVIADLNRYLDGEIRIGDPALAQIRVVAILEMQDRDAMIKAIESALSVKAARISKKVTLLFPAP
jgi:transmembrane sensor